LEERLRGKWRGEGGGKREGYRLNDTQREEGEKPVGASVQDRSTEEFQSFLGNTDEEEDSSSECQLTPSSGASKDIRPVRKRGESGLLPRQTYEILQSVLRSFFGFSSFLGYFFF
jgi:hypothetical protein